MRLSPTWLLAAVPLLCAVASALSSCRQGNDGHHEIPDHNTLYLYGLVAEPTIRVADNAWSPGDAIGLLAYPTGERSSGPLYTNVRMTTADGSGLFRSSGEGIPMTGQLAIDLLAYYPYVSSLQGGHTIPVSLRDQSVPSRLDLMVAEATGVSQAGTRITFERQLSRIVLQLEGADGFGDLTDVVIYADGVATQATYDLLTRTLSPTAERSTVQLYGQGRGRRVVHSALLLPGTDLSSIRLRVTFRGREFGFTPTAQVVERGQTYRYVFRISGSEQMMVLQLLNPKGTKIEDLDDVIILNPISGEPEPGQAGGDTGTTPEPEPDPTPTDEYMAGTFSHYGEQPRVLKSNPHHIIQVQHTSPDSHFGGGSTATGRRRNYTVYFSTDLHQPLCIAYPLYRDCIGGAKRTDAWEYDPQVPRSSQPNLASSYVSGYSRGHMLASSMRTATTQLNRTTFYFTNMVPQEQTQNGGVWNQLEQLETSWAKSAAAGDTLYVAAGPIVPSNPTKHVRTKGSNDLIPVPSHTYKAILKKNRAGEWHTLAIKMPNNATAPRWDRCIVTVEELEQELGIVLFPHLAPGVAQRVKASKATGAYWSE